MWTETTRHQYRREDLRYASDMTDAEWTLIEPDMPMQTCRSSWGSPEKYSCERLSRLCCIFCEPRVRGVCRIT